MFRCFLSSVGMLSKAKGLILRVAGILHVLFHLGSRVGDIPQEICADALKAAENYVDVCCQHVAYIAGRGDMQGAILQIQKGLYQSMQCISFKFMYIKEKDHKHSKAIHVFIVSVVIHFKIYASVLEC